MTQLSTFALPPYRPTALPTEQVRQLHEEAVGVPFQVVEGEGRRTGVPGTIAEEDDRPGGRLVRAEEVDPEVVGLVGRCGHPSRTERRAGRSLERRLPLRGVLTDKAEEEPATR